MKPVTFDEWIGKNNFEQMPLIGMFELARQGMIPAENAVVIPPAVEWPVWATGVQTAFVAYQNPGRITGFDPFWNDMKPGDLRKQWQEIAHMPRPVPAWVPSVGDVVFVLLDTRISAGLVMNSTIQYIVKTLTTEQFLVHRNKLKPFSTEHIGKPWDAMPGGVE